MALSDVYVFRVTLDIERSPKMEDGAQNRRIAATWEAPVREIAVLASHSLYTLAEAINAAFGFAFDHCFGFYSPTRGGRYHEAERQYELFADLPDVEPTQAASVEKTFVHEVWEKPGNRMDFYFDYGDNWWFTVEFLECQERKRGEKYPKVLRRVGRAPQQYPPV